MKEKPIVTVEAVKEFMDANIGFYVSIDDGSIRRYVQPMIFVGKPIDDDGAYRQPSFRLEEETAVAFLRAMAKLAHDRGIRFDGDDDQPDPSWPTVRESERLREPVSPATEAEREAIAKRRNEVLNIPTRAKFSTSTKEENA